MRKQKSRTRSKIAQHGIFVFNIRSLADVQSSTTDVCLCYSPCFGLKDFFQSVSFHDFHLARSKAVEILWCEGEVNHLNLELINWACVQEIFVECDLGQVAYPASESKQYDLLLHLNVTSLPNQKRICMFTYGHGELTSNVVLLLPKFIAHELFNKTLKIIKNKQGRKKTYLLFTYAYENFFQQKCSGCNLDTAVMFLNKKFKVL